MIEYVNKETFIRLLDMKLDDMLMIYVLKIFIYYEYTNFEF